MIKKEKPVRNSIDNSLVEESEYFYRDNEMMRTSLENNDILEKIHNKKKKDFISNNNIEN